MPPPPGSDAYDRYKYIPVYVKQQINLKVRYDKS